MRISEEKEKEEPFAKYKDLLYRVAFSNMKNKSDAEDVVQETFLPLSENETRVCR